jgi:hypothetical protein
VGLTLAITLPQIAPSEESGHAVAAQVNGDVRRVISAILYFKTASCLDLVAEMRLPDKWRRWKWGATGNGSFRYRHKILLGRHQSVQYPKNCFPLKKQAFASIARAEDTRGERTVDWIKLQKKSNAKETLCAVI